MSYLYLTENNLYVGITNNQLYVKNGNETESIPIETLESISVFGNGQLSTQCIHECMKRNIPILYYSSVGAYIGRTQAIDNTNVNRIKKQMEFVTTNSAIILSKKIIISKIHNQIVAMSRYAKSKNMDIHHQIIQMKILKTKIELCEDTETIMGYEGNAARIYFSVLSQAVDDEFKFNGRNRRPPKDPFNELVSLGYTIITNEIYGKIEGKGLTPYIGFLHKMNKKHPILASDLIEEWRPVIVDSIVMSLINGHEITRDCFTKCYETGGIYLNKEGKKIFFDKLENRMRSEMKYLEYADFPVSFRRGLELQVNAFNNVLENNNPDMYIPIKIR